MPANTPVRTLYYRAMRRVERRARTYVATLRDDPTCADCLALDDRLLREACRLANRLALIA